MPPGLLRIRRKRIKCAITNRLVFFNKVMIEVEISRIIIDEERKEQVIVLKDKKTARAFPIIIGINEAVAIKMHLTDIVVPRPLTYDLIASILNELGACLEKVVIDKLVDNTFHAKVHVRTSGKGIKIIDARPSDGIALASKTKAPVFVEETVWGTLSETL